MPSGELNEPADPFIEGAMIDAAVALERVRLRGHIESLVDLALDEERGEMRRHKAVNDIKVLCLFAASDGVQALQSIAGLSEDDDLAAYAVVSFVELADGAQNPQAFIAEMSKEQSQLRSLDVSTVALTLRHIRQELLDYIDLCDESSYNSLVTISENTEDSTILQASELALNKIGSSYTH